MIVIGKRLRLLDEPISALCDGLDVARLSRLVAQGLAQTRDALIDRVLPDDDAGPDHGQDLVRAHDLAGMLAEMHQQVHVTWLDANLFAAALYDVELRSHAPVAELKLIAFGHSSDPFTASFTGAPSGAWLATGIGRKPLGKDQVTLKTQLVGAARTRAGRHRIGWFSTSRSLRAGLAGRPHWRVPAPHGRILHHEQP